MVATVLGGCLYGGEGFLQEGFTIQLPDVLHGLDLNIVPVASLLPVLLHPVKTSHRLHYILPNY